jgi:SAM-dependent methyltransferase
MIGMNKKVERDFVTEAEIDLLELEWWNSNAEIISKVWEMDHDVSWAIRKKYLSRAKRFLKDKGQTTSVLELGCGSGWVGQSIADAALTVLGTDASEAQIALARENAKKKGLERICHYFTSDSLDWSAPPGRVNAVLIHSFLHHLNKKEIDRLFDQSRRSFSSGTRFWIYEPAFYAASQQVDTNDSNSRWPALSRLAPRVIAVLSACYQRYGLIDEATSQEFKALMQQANEKGWYLSPKEVPFDVDAFTDYLERYFQVRAKYWATINAVGMIFETNLIKNRLLRKIITGSVAPLISYSDSALASNVHFLRRSLTAPNYGLHVWECILK